MSGGTAYQIVYDLSNPTAPVGRIAVIDPDGDATYQPVSGFPSTLLVHPNGSVYYSTADFTGDESKVWILGQTDPVLIMGGTPLHVPVLAPDGAIYVPTWAPNISKSYIAVIRPGQDTVVEEFDGLAYPDRPMVLTPTAAMSTRVLVVNPTGSSTTTVLDGVLPAGGPSITPTGDIYQTVGPEWEGPHTIVQINP